MMDSYYQVVSSPASAWLTDEPEQDFCYGAKTSTPQHPSYATPPPVSPSVFSPEWVDMKSTFEEDFSSLEAFDNVILPKTADFGPDDLFADINADSLTPVGLSASSLSADSGSQSSSRLSPKVTIKLKKVKHKSSKLRKQSSSIYGNDSSRDARLAFEVINPKDAYSLYDSGTLGDYKCSPISEYHDFDHQAQQEQKFQYGHLGPSVLPEYSSSIPETTLFSTDDDHFLLDDSKQPLTTLRDVIDKGEADKVLEECLTYEDIPTINVDDQQCLEFSIDPEQSSILFMDSESSVCSSPSSSLTFSPTNTLDSAYQLSHSSLDIGDSSPSRILSENFESLQVEGTKSKGKTKRKSLPHEVRRLKKKQQNKEAALRYRQKKKQEDELLQATFNKLEMEQEVLKKRKADLGQEVQILKKLMREALIAKNVVSKDAFQSVSWR